MKLTARLEKISSLVDPGKKIADIGTDHAYIPSYLMSKGLVSEAILTDVNKGPLDNAKSEISKLGFEDRCQLRLGNGLEVVKPGEVDQIIIAGMGGILISDAKYYLKMWDDSKQSFRKYKDSVSQMHDKTKEDDEALEELKQKCKEYESTCFDLQMENIQLKSKLEKMQ